LYDKGNDGHEDARTHEIQKDDQKDRTQRAARRQPARLHDSIVARRRARFAEVWG
jgi:hypothetical protein